MLRLGIDLGGTKIEGIAIDERGHELARCRVSTPPGYSATLGAIRELVAHLEVEVGREGSVGIGIPGSVSPSTGRIRNANSTWLNDQPLPSDLEAALRRPVRLRNDADCFALSEATDGAGAGVSSVFGVILGTGVGGGVVIDGTLLPGASGIAGEWGHNPLPMTAGESEACPACWCGRNGCVESWLSGPGLSADHERVEGSRVTAEQLGVLIEEGDPAAARTLDRYVSRLARALGVVVNVLDPGAVVLGGGVSNLADLASRVETELHRHIFSDHPIVSVRRNRHGDSSGVRGAAWLWPESPPG